MSEIKFKVGDLVYCPEVSHKILKIDTIEYDCIYFKVGEFGLKILTNDDSLIWENWIFHATQENYELLSKRYPNVSFEPPPKRKEPREIIKAMLKAGYDGVPCKTDCKQYRFVCTDVSNDQYFPFAYDNVNGEPDAFSSAIPYCYKTGKIIIDFVDGKVVLEN